jgi:hypothetical protein
MNMKSGDWKLKAWKEEKRNKKMNMKFEDRRLKMKKEKWKEEKRIKKWKWRLQSEDWKMEGEKEN